MTKHQTTAEIVRALTITQGDVIAASDLLNVSTGTIYARIRTTPGLIDIVHDLRKQRIKERLKAIREKHTAAAAEAEKTAGEFADLERIAAEPSAEDLERITQPPTLEDLERLTKYEIQN